MCVASSARCARLPDPRCRYKRKVVLSALDPSKQHLVIQKQQQPLHLAVGPSATAGLMGPTAEESQAMAKRTEKLRKQSVEAAVARMRQAREHARLRSQFGVRQGDELRARRKKEARPVTRSRVVHPKEVEAEEAKEAEADSTTKSRPGSGVASVASKTTRASRTRSGGSSAARGASREKTVWK